MAVMFAIGGLRYPRRTSVSYNKLRQYDIATRQLHVLEYIETHTNSPDSIHFRPTTSWRTSLRHGYHGFYSLIPHRRTVRLQHLTNLLKEPRWIKHPMSDFLLDQVRIKDGPKSGRLRGVLLHLRL